MAVFFLGSIEHATLVGGDHVFDVDEGVLEYIVWGECYFSSSLLEEFECFLDEVTGVLSLALIVVDLVSDVGVGVFVEVHDGEELPVVGD